MASQNSDLLNEVQFGALVRALAQDVVDAHIHWDQHNALQAQLEKWPQVQAEAWPFWGYTLTAHRRTTLAALARVFDQEENSLHLYAWLTTIRSHLRLFGNHPVHHRPSDDPFAKWLPEGVVAPDTQQLEDDIALCAIADPDVLALVRYRNNLLAHRGRKLSLQGDAAKLPTLLYEQIDRLLERARTLLNRYNYMFDASVFSMTPLGHDAVETVFECVQRDLDHREEKEAARMAAAQARVQEFQHHIQLINATAEGREDEARAERKALAERYGYTINDAGDITGVVLFRGPKQTPHDGRRKS
ncbi:hypothetical protein [Dyella subtropica]|uniref:AbiU2 domain-containing protein n=1 Tax=Dyella subtropica TaxID=2992127 RepID=UPI002251B218|nr:hypothetical protein [Dyella subtropica]